MSGSAEKGNQYLVGKYTLKGGKKMWSGTIERRIPGRTVFVPSKDMNKTL